MGLYIDCWGISYEHIPIPPDTIPESVKQMLKYKRNNLRSDEMNELMSIENADTLFNLNTRDQAGVLPPTMYDFN